MNKIKNLALYVVAAIGLTACAVEDNGGIGTVTYKQAETFKPAGETRVVTLNHVTGQASVAAVVADWLTISPVEAADDAAAKVEVTVSENTTGQERSAVQSITVGDAAVNLTITQGAITVDDPFESVTDQPAYAPRK